MRPASVSESLPPARDPYRSDAQRVLSPAVPAVWVPLRLRVHVLSLLVTVMAVIFAEANGWAFSCE